MKLQKPERNCQICERIKLIQANKSPYFVRELATGYVVLGDSQYFRGYTLFLSKVHARELHELDTLTRNVFLLEMARTAAAVYRVFQPDKLNYELLGNTDAHLHWHLIPRYINDPAWGKPIWILDKEVRNSVHFSASDFESLKRALLEELTRSPAEAVD